MGQGSLFINCKDAIDEKVGDVGSIGWLAKPWPMETGL